jgi:hypothetical protein
MNLCFDNTVVACTLTAAPSVEPFAARFLDFVSPAFSIRAQTRAPTLKMQLMAFAEFPDALRHCCSTPVVVRGSPNPLFELNLKVGRDHRGRSVGIDEATRTAFVVDAEERSAEIYVSDRSFVHVIEFFRYTSLLAEGASETVLLHASAVMTDRGLVLIIGQKGAGKSTTLLEMCLRHGATHFSGDKILLSIASGKVCARAWPDYPHFGLGTLSLWPELLQKWDLSLQNADGSPRSLDEKVLIDPPKFKESIAISSSGYTEEIFAILWPEIKSPNPQFRERSAEEKLAADLLSNIEDPEQFTPAKWHGIKFPKLAAPRHGQILDGLISAAWFDVRGGCAIPAQIFR